MPRDKRLYMTFPIDFDEHPKVAPLTDAAFRAFVAMNGYSRRHSLDGRIPVAVATKRWRPRVLDELVASHADRPLVLLDDDTYVIRDYAEHQLTTEAIEKERETNRLNGLKGGRPAKRKRSETGSVSESEPIQNQSQSQSRESELEDLDDVTNYPESALGPSTRKRGLDPLRDVIDDKMIAAQAEAERLGIKSITTTRDLFEAASGQTMTLRGALEVASVILNRSKHPVRDADAYIATVCRTTPDEIREVCDQLDLGALV